MNILLDVLIKWPLRRLGMREAEAREIVKYDPHPQFECDMVPKHSEAKGYLEALGKAKPLLEALKEIKDSGSKTLLGRCCVDKRCIPSESGASCELQEKANSAFSQSASEAGEALAQYEAKK